MATTSLATVGTALQGVGLALQAAAGGAGAQPAAAPAPAAAPVDQFAPAGGVAAGGGDQLTGLVSNLVNMLQQLLGLIQQLVGGGQGQAQGQGPQGAANTGAGASAGSASSPVAAPAAGASSGASSSGAASAAAAASPASAPAPESPPQPSGGDGGGGDGGGGGGGGGGDGGDPLVFDLTGRGVGFDNSRTTTANLNGKGGERINDLAAGTGLLTFAGDPGKGVLANSFGDKTDLSKFGIKGDRPDGTFSNGFSAIRALGEHFGLIKPGDQVLDGNELRQLEQLAGVKMRVGGVNGRDVSLADLGITQINLGDPNAVESKEQAARDANGNVIQRQAGASFVMNGQTRGYADAWFQEQSGKAAA